MRVIPDRYGGYVSLGAYVPPGEPVQLVFSANTSLDAGHKVRTSLHSSSMCKKDHPWKRLCGSMRRTLELDALTRHPGNGMGGMLYIQLDTAAPHTPQKYVLPGRRSCYSPAVSSPHA